MTGLLIVTALVVLLILALAPAHRRAEGAWRPGFDTRRDRDRPRVLADLAAAADRLAERVDDGADPGMRRFPGATDQAPELRTQPTWLPDHQRRAA